MSIKKRILAAFLCVFACLTVFPAPQAQAAGAAVINPQSSQVMPLMEYIYEAGHKLHVSDGQATVYAFVRGNSSVATKCKITVELQEKGLIFWSTVKSWSATESGRSAELTAFQEVTSGKSYRLTTTVTVWSGSDSETQTFTSDSIKA